MPITSPAKLQIIDFIKKSKLNEPYEFTLKGDKFEAGKFVQCMRVELSRMKKLVKLRGGVPVHFKMRLTKVETLPGNRSCKITLTKTKSMHNVDEEVNAILDDLTGGSQIA